MWNFRDLGFPDYIPRNGRIHFVDIDLKTPLLFLLDEIHKVKGREEYVIDLSRNPNWKVVVSGSSSKMLKHGGWFYLRPS